MKQRILFVDDEINILKALRRTLRPYRGQWDMAFSPGAEKALKTLEKESFDVVITDMRMPGMDGAKLLQIVKEKYPQMVRIILSGHSDQEMIMKSVKTAHQYLTKPCEKEILVNAVKRSFSLRQLLSQDNLLDLLGGIETMPSLPSLYLEVVNELKSGTASTENVGRIISKDMGMTAKVLQLVNSSFFGMSRHISNAQDAVVMLGIDVVKTLVLGMEVFSQVSKKTLSVLPIDNIYSHCVRSGGIAKAIARIENKDKEEIDNSVIAAVLHDMGKLILVEYFPDRYKDAIALAKKEKSPVFKSEQEIFNVSHSQVGAYILGLWGFPDSIVEAVAFHHHPGDNLSVGLDLAGIVHLADIIEYHEQYQSGTWERLAGADEQYIKDQGLTDRLPLWRDYLRSIKNG